MKKKPTKKPRETAAPPQAKRAKTEADKLKAAGVDASRSNLFHVYPEDVALITDPAHPLYDERVNLPVEPDSPIYRDIERKGVEKPIEVRKNGEDRHGRPILQVVDGRQRVMILRHINAAGSGVRRKIPVQFVHGDDKSMVLRGLSSNLLRREETPFTKAVKMGKAAALGCGLEEIAQACNMRDTRAVEEHLAILNFVPEVQQAFNGELPAGAVKVFAKVPREEQLAALETVRKGGAKTKRQVKAAVEASRRGEEYVAPTGTDTVASTRIEKLRSAFNRMLEDVEDSFDGVSHERYGFERHALRAALHVTEYLLGNEDAFDSIDILQKALKRAMRDEVHAELNAEALNLPLVHVEASACGGVADVHSITPVEPRTADAQAVAVADAPPALTNTNPHTLTF